MASLRWFLLVTLGPISRKASSGAFCTKTNLALGQVYRCPAILKYTAMASYLEPTPTDVEVIEAIRHHFLVMVQRAMIGIQLSTVGVALDLLRRVEMMGMGHTQVRTR
jgi:hypothetical protein